MNTSKNFLAFDLGAESGRAILGRLRGESVDLDIIHRFSNTPVRVPDGLHWDVLRLFQEMKDGLQAAARQNEIASVGLDTWGVDFALLDPTGALLANPHHYRDTRTDGMMEEVFQVVPKADVFFQTGIQFMQINTLFQLYALKTRNPHLLEMAKSILLIPDLFNYWFTGVQACEFTEATTSQMFNPFLGAWAKDLLRKLDLPEHKFGNIIQPGSKLGPILPQIAKDCASDHIPLIAPATHDTGSAVASVPTASEDFVYISSGTWSLVGVEVKEPVINEKSLAYNFTNEGGVSGTYRLLRNVAGLWIVQECRRTWEMQGVSYDYRKLTELATESSPFKYLIDPDDTVFSTHGDMPSRIQEYCKSTRQGCPEEPGQIVRTALDSLALKYRWVVERLEELVKHKLTVIHIVGGGTQNRLLSQLAADATGREVIAGPVEATATGNILVQAMGMGELGSLADIRQVVRNSFDLEHYEPNKESCQIVEDAYGRFLRLLG